MRARIVNLSQKIEIITTLYIHKGLNLITGFVPSYVLDSGIGKKIAMLKGLEEGWHYPTFLLQYVRNPGPLLLFDEIVVDEEAARKAIEYVTGLRRKPKDYEGRVIDALRPAKSEVQIFHELIESNLFRKEKVVEMITNSDFARIKQGYDRDSGINESPPSGFINAVDVMKRRYGPDYALPNPERFEAMNINVTWVLSEKLSAVPLDDILRSPLYEYKAVQATSLGTEMTKTAYEMINQARQVLYLPTKPLHDVDDLFVLHKDPRVRKYREKVRDLSEKRATPREISREIYNANLELQKLDIQTYTLVIGFFNLIAGLLSMQCDFSTGSLGTATGLMLIGKELRKIWKMKRYGWLEIVQGLCEI